MTYLDLLDKIATPIFTILDVAKQFPFDSDQTIRIQLSRFAKRGLITEIKRGLYVFPKGKIDELELARYLYQPSYISLETALNYHGVIPDIAVNTISVTPTTTKKFTTKLGNFHFQKIQPHLFFGYTFIPLGEGRGFNIALPEKALLDYIYIHGKKNADSLRLDMSKINKKLYNVFNKEFSR